MGITNYKVYEKFNLSKDDIISALLESNISVTGYRYKAETDGDCITLKSKADSLLFHNSFIPKVEIRLFEKEDDVQVEYNFMLNDTARIAFYVLNIILIFMSAIMVVVSLFPPIECSLLLIAPFILAFQYVISYLGLRLAGKSVLKQLKELLTR